MPGCYIVTIVLAVFLLLVKHCFLCNNRKIKFPIYYYIVMLAIFAIPVIGSLVYGAIAFAFLFRVADGTFTLKLKNERLNQFLNKEI
jgi:hypothetical protein